MKTIIFLIFVILLSMVVLAYTPPAGNSIEIILESPYTAPAGNQIELQLIDFHNEITPPVDSCTYTSGDWFINCGDNCDIVPTDLGGNNIYASGIGIITNLKVNTYNYQKRIIDGGCQAIN